MGSSEKLCLKWDDFQTNISSSFGQMRKDQDFSDVTLTCDGDQKIEAHKVILVASSSFFGRLLKQNKHPHPLIYMRGMTNKQLSEVVDFIYHGEVNIYEENIEDFLTLAEELKLKGLNNSENRTPNPTTRHSEITPKKPKNNPNSEILEVYSDNIESSSFYLNPSIEETSLVPSTTSVKTGTNNGELDETIDSMIERLETGGYKCNVCGKLERRSILIRHIESMHIEGVSHPCGNCGKLFRSRNSLAGHISQLHAVYK